MDFCVASSRKGLRGSGLEVGDTVLVAALKPTPVKRSDPYLQRLLTVVLKVKDGVVLTPDNIEGDESNGYNSYLVDPRCLTLLSEEEQVLLKLEIEAHDK